MDTLPDHWEEHRRLLVHPHMTHSEAARVHSQKLRMYRDAVRAKEAEMEHELAATARRAAGVPSGFIELEATEFNKPLLGGLIQSGPSDLGPKADVVDKEFHEAQKEQQE